MQAGDLVHIPQAVTMIQYQGPKQMFQWAHKTEKPSLAVYLGDSTIPMWRFSSGTDTAPRVFWRGSEWLVDQRDLFPVEDTNVNKAD